MQRNRISLPADRCMAQMAENITRLDEGIAQVVYRVNHENRIDHLEGNPPK